MRFGALRLEIVHFGVLVALGMPATTRSLEAQDEAPQRQLTLADAIARAQETYPSQLAAQAGVEASEAAVGVATAQRWPRLSTNASLTRFEEPMLVAPLHRFDITQRPEFDETLLRGDVTLAWTLFDGGARGARIGGARAEAAGSLAGRRSVEMELTAQVTVAYLEVLTARGVLEAQDRRIVALSAERRRVDELLGQGRAARVELLRVDAALAVAEADRVATRARLDLAERELARLVGAPVEEARAFLLRPLWLVDPDAEPERAALVERARSASPELEGARQVVLAAEAGSRLAKADWLPRLDVVGSYLGFGSTTGGGTMEWQAGVSLSYPLFTGGARLSAVGAARAQERRAREELRLAELGLEQAVDVALNAEREARALVAAVSQAVQHQAEVVRIERLSLEAGAGTQTDYLSSEAELLRVRSALIEARNRQVAARVELVRVVGELDTAWLAANLEVAR